MQLRIVGETKLKQDVMCPFCKNTGRKGGSVVEIIQDSDTNLQYASFTCLSCKENVMTR